MHFGFMSSRVFLSVGVEHFYRASVHLFGPRKNNMSFAEHAVELSSGVGGEQYRHSRTPVALPICTCPNPICRLARVDVVPRAVEVTSRLDPITWPVV
jgi:hypothetical protein